MRDSGWLRNRGTGLAVALSISELAETVAARQWTGVAVLQVCGWRNVAAERELLRVL